MEDSDVLEKDASAATLLKREDQTVKTEAKTKKKQKAVAANEEDGSDSDSSALSSTSLIVLIVYGGEGRGSRRPKQQNFIFLGDTGEVEEDVKKLNFYANKACKDAPLLEGNYLFKH